MFKWLFGSKGDDAGAAQANESKELVVIQHKVPVPPERAFAIFVDEFNSWWPRDATWGGANLQEIVIEPRFNGRCYEREADGSERTWGTVLSVTRPEHIVIAWQIRADRTPEPEEGASSRVDIRFSPADDNATNLIVVHRDFARHGEGWQKYKSQMGAKDGWPRLIGLYAKAAEAAQAKA